VENTTRPPHFPSGSGPSVTRCALQVNPGWRITVCTNQKQLKLEGFSVLDEWSDMTSVRPWSNAWKAGKDTEWLQEYYKKEKKSMGSGEGAAAPS
jgi:hypothetical protein